MKKINFSFSITRWIGVVIKEIHELRRDKVSISMVLLTPLFQLIILGYA
ncbi:ABC transporter permease, partial [Klebsiella pneumoniae]